MRNLSLRGLDAWITREDEPSEELWTCDVCDRRYPKDQMWTGFAFGIETTACARCRGADVDDDTEDRAPDTHTCGPD
jgi:hypothetical protein